MTVNNSYIKQITLNKVKYVLVKDGAGNIKKINVDIIKARTGSVIEIIPFMGKNIPDGLLLCDGKEYHKDDYPDLYSVIGRRFCLPSDTDVNMFRVPDLVTDNRFCTSGDQVNYISAKDAVPSSGEHIYCQDTILNHTHSIKSQSAGRYGSGSTDVVYRHARTIQDETQETGSDETAGRNMAVNFCIRTGNINTDRKRRGITSGDQRETTFSEFRITLTK